MYEGKMVFAQVMEHLPLPTLRRCIARFGATARSRGSAASTSSAAWRSPSSPTARACATSKPASHAQPKLYHMGFASVRRAAPWRMPTRRRDWRIYAGFAQALIGKLDGSMPTTVRRRTRRKPSTRSTPPPSIYACRLSLGAFRPTKAPSSCTPCSICGAISRPSSTSTTAMHDVDILDQLCPRPGAIYIMDRGYVDFARSIACTEAGAFFVVRAKTNARLAAPRYSRPVDGATGLICDQTIVRVARFAGRYPDRCAASGSTIRRRQDVVFLTNNFACPPVTIAELYRCRWQVELFFKWIKQHLRIKAFYGTTENAVKTQIWIAISVYVLVAIVKKQLQLKGSLYRILQIPQRQRFRENPAKSATDRGPARKPTARARQTIESLRRLAGHYWACPRYPAIRSRRSMARWIPVHKAPG